MASRIAFHGATKTVTGSKHLITTNGKRILVDCGLYQGERLLRDLNWQEFPFDPASLDAVLITHAHTDHIGMLPRLVAQGYRGPIYATPATIGIARISLPDSGRLQEEEARHVNKIGGSRHQPAMPLYTERDAFQALKSFEPVRYHENLSLPGKATARYSPAGHILGSAFIEVFFDNGERILMSGDLGRYGTPIIKDPTTMAMAEYLVVESTYGDRLHADEDPLEVLERILNAAYANGSAVIIPSFAIGRTQELCYHMKVLQDQGRLPRIPIFIDSPMAISATKVYADAKDEHDEEMKIAVDESRHPLEPTGLKLIRDREQSKALNAQDGPLVIISGSGMANGGRVKHHLQHRLHDPNTVVLFTGYQAVGTLGREILEGAERVRIFHQDVSVRAQIEKLNSLSAHADQNEIMRWLGGFRQAPRTTFLVHGEPPAQAVLAEKIREELGWNVVIPTLHDEFDL